MFPQAGEEGTNGEVAAPPPAGEAGDPPVQPEQGDPPVQPEQGEPAGDPAGEGAEAQAPPAPQAAEEAQPEAAAAPQESLMQPGSEAAVAAAEAAASIAAAAVAAHAAAGYGAMQQPEQPQRAEVNLDQTTVQVHEDGTVSESWMCPKGLVGKLIGRGGSTIMQLQVRSAAVQKFQRRAEDADSAQMRT